ncbi:MaoC family dehydratase [Arthrobacter crystallopoietes]|jgi:acyl dehydratase|uniref:MaoC family dehydratase n=1 Tax=Crystallibacter crystallopoietes TaxID=37928 RepID=UPI0011112923
MPALSDLSVGQEIGSTSIDVSRADLVRYAGASGDFNPIHWNDRFAEQVGLPGVIAHGMFTMGAAVQLVTDWVGNPAAVVDYQTRFTKPVVVENLDAGGATLEVAGVIGAVDEANSSVRVDLTVTAAGQKVLVKAQAVVRAW